jgi:hypothetical protein
MYHSRRTVSDGPVHPDIKPPGDRALAGIPNSTKTKIPEHKKSSAHISRPNEKIAPDRPKGSNDLPREEEVKDTTGTTKFFWLWFGIPFLILVAVAWAAGHC